MASSFRGFFAVWMLYCAAGLALAQTAKLDLRVTRYELQPGIPVPLEVAPETSDFLINAKTRTVEVDGAPASGLSAGPSQAKDRILVAASLRMNPGPHTVRISATSDSGEERQATFSVVVQALPTVPSGSTRPPVVLVNGWTAGFTGVCNLASSAQDTFGFLAQQLIADGVPAVYLFDNCLEDANQSIEVLGNDLGTFLNSIKYDTGAQVPQIDLVCHSMGGLIARSYLAGLQPQTGLVLTPPTTTLVRRMVLIATPNFGSYLGSTSIVAFGQSTQGMEMIPGSSFLWNLGTWNQRTDDVRGVDTIAVVGNAGSYSSMLANATDGFVSLTSGSAGFIAQSTSVTRVVPYCHVDPVVFTNINIGTFGCSGAGIANVTDTTHLTGRIVRSFLAGNSDWRSIGTSPTADPYLSKFGGTFFTLVGSSGSYVTDISQVQWGNLTMANAGAVGTIFTDDMVSGSGLFKVTSKSLNSVNCGTVAQAAGYIVPTRCKIAAAITSVSPLAKVSGKVVASGASLTLNGAGFGTQCSGCKVTATPAGSTTAQTLTVTSWTASAITVSLPASLTGFLTLTVNTSNGSDNITVMAITASPGIAAAPNTIQFTYTIGGAAPAAQTVVISNTGSGTLNWTATSNASWLSIDQMLGTAPSTVSISASPAGMTAGTYQGMIQVMSSGATNSPQSISVTLVVQTGTAGTISGVVNTASFQPGFASATWVSIFGSNLSPTMDSWQASTFLNGALPTALDGVSVTINGILAYVSYISPTQINVLAPDDATVGDVQVHVTSGSLQSNSYTAAKAAFAPAFFLVGSGPYAVAQHPDYSLVGSPNLIAGVTTSPASPGETIQFYATGFGPTTPPAPTGQMVNAPSMLANQPQVTIGGVAATVTFAGLVGSGLYQLNVTVPDLPNGDAAVVATVAGVQSQTGVMIPVQK
jgi:uncharacterized protein (TIGR03437 family)